MSKTRLRLMQAGNVQHRTPIAFGGTEAKPEPPIHATAYKRGNIIIIAKSKGAPVEFRPTEKIRVSYDPVGSGAAHLRWCKSCEEPHLRYLGADAYNTAYCHVRDRRYKPVAERAGYVPPKDRKISEVEARLNRTMEWQPASQDRLMAATLRARLTLQGEPKMELKAAEFGLTLAEAYALIEREYPAEQVVVHEEPPAEEVAAS